MREAIDNAVDGEIISFAPELTGRTIVLAGGQLSIDDDVQIVGPGTGLLTIDAHHASRVMRIVTGATATISGLTIANGTDFSGGGNVSVQAGSTVTFDRVKISGGIANFGAGGISSTGNLTIKNSTVENNQAAGGGGLSHSTGQLKILGSTFVGNSSSVSTGAIAASGPTLEILNTTVSGNQSGFSTAGIFISGPTTATLTNLTVTNNVSNGSIVGIQVSGVSASVKLTNSIVAGNLSAGAGAGNDVGGVFAATSDYNLISKVSGGSFPGSHNQLGVANIGLGPLADNGGPTWSHAVLANSPAINAGSVAAAFSSSLSVDQRGYNRFVYDPNNPGGGVDLGAVERGWVVTALVDADNGNYSANDLSLREALALAKLTGVPAERDRITFDSLLAHRTVKLNGLELLVDSAVDIVGLGQDVQFIEGIGGSRIFNIAPGGNAIISGLTIAKGNHSTNGGNVLVQTGGTVTFDQVTITEGTSHFGAGGIYSTGNLTLKDSTVSKNLAGGGGAGAVRHASGTLKITGSTFFGNSTGAGSASVLATGSNIEIINSTFSSNRGPASAALQIGEAATPSTATLRGVTISNNVVSSGSVVAGLHVVGPGSVATVHNSIASGNRVVNPGGTFAAIDVGTSLGGAIASSSNYNLISSYIGLFPTNNNLFTSYAGLSFLGFWGGPTMTHALLPDSPAIDAGQPFLLAGISASAADQRGGPYVRVVDGNLDLVHRIDIGAVEYRPRLEVSVASDEVNGVYGSDLSLREALQLAEFLPGLDVITFASTLIFAGSTIHLDGTELLISSDTSILGPGFGRMTINAGLSSRVFHVAPGVTATIQGLGITQGSAPSGSYGGGILNEGSLTVDRSSVFNNFATIGAGIASAASSSKLTVIDSEVSTNVASSTGGGIATIEMKNGSVLIENSSIRSNSAVDGGGIYMVGASSLLDMVISRSTIALNTASANGGGVAISTLTSAKPVRITRSTISTNHAQGNGGGIYANYSSFNGGSPIALYDSTLSANVAGFNTTTLRSGGGLFASYAPLTFVNVTVTDNEADVGAGIHATGAAFVSIKSNNAIVANNRNVGSGIFDVAGSFTFASGSTHNLIGFASAGGIADDRNGPTGNIALLPGESAGLAPLANYGGPTRTHALLPNSLAVDKGSDVAAIDAALTVDQRGYERILLGKTVGVARTDIGAVEHFKMPADIFQELDANDSTPNVLEVSSETLHVLDRDPASATHEQQLLDALFSTGTAGISLVNLGQTGDGFKVTGLTKGPTGPGVPFLDNESSVGVYANYLPAKDNVFGLGPYGVVLSTGDVSDFGTAPNDRHDHTVEYGMELSLTDTVLRPLLEQITPGAIYKDVSSMTLEFNAASGVREIAFSIAFGSDEYPDFIHNIVDAFGVFLNGVQQFPQLIPYAPEMTHSSRGSGVTNGPLWGGTNPLSPDFVPPGTVLRPTPSVNTNHPQMTGENESDAFNELIVGHPISELDGVMWPHSRDYGGDLVPARTSLLQFRIPIQATGNRLVVVIADTKDFAFDSTLYISGLRGVTSSAASTEAMSLVGGMSSAYSRSLAGTSIQRDVTFASRLGAGEITGDFLAIEVAMSVSSTAALRPSTENLRHAATLSNSCLDDSSSALEIGPSVLDWQTMDTTEDLGTVDEESANFSELVAWKC